MDGKELLYHVFIGSDERPLDTWSHYLFWMTVVMVAVIIAPYHAIEELPAQLYFQIQAGVLYLYTGIVAVPIALAWKHGGLKEFEQAWKEANRE